MIAVLLAVALASNLPGEPTPATPAPSTLEAGIAAWKANDCTTAIPLLKKNAGTHRDAAIALRACYEAQYKTPDALLAALDAEVKANPNDAVAHTNLGAYEMLAGKKDEAKNELIRAVELDPQNLDARFNLAWWYSAVGQAHTAIHEHENILKDHPDFAASMTELCTLLSQVENDAKKAEPWCAKAAALDPTNEVLGVNLGLVRMQAGDPAGAQKALEAVLAAHPDSTRSKTFLGVIQLQRNDFDGAQKAFEEVLAKSPDDVDARVNLARTFQAKKEYGRAATEYRAAYHESGNSMLLGALVKVYLQQYYYFIVFGLLLAMGWLLYRYLDVKAPPPASEGPKPAAA